MEQTTDLARFKLDDVTYELDLSRLSNREADLCEQLTGWTWVEWLKALLEDESRPPRAITFLYWLALSRQSDEPPKFSELEYNVLSFEWVEDEAEVEASAESGDAVVPTSPGPVSTTEVVEIVSESLTA